MDKIDIKSKQATPHTSIYAKTPWKVAGSSSPYIVDGDGNTVAYVNNAYRTREEVTSNCKLVALAPRLMELTRWISTQPDTTLPLSIKLEISAILKDFYG